MKYIFVCPNVQFLAIQYRDFCLGDNTDLVLLGGARKIFKFLNYKIKFCKFRLATSLALRRVFKKSKFDNDPEKKCFILYSRTFEDFRKPIVDFLKKRYPDCVVCIYYGDLCYRHFCTIDEAKATADFVFSFDEGEATQYGIHYLLEPFSLSIESMKELYSGSSPKKHDISFVGHAKNRFQRILDIFEVLRKKGLDCEIHISGVENANQKTNPCIQYGAIDFVSLLRTVVESGCILEIMQNDGVSPTTRFAESIVLKRFLLTDCVFFKNHSFPNVIYYENMDDLSKMELGFLREEPKIDIETVNLFSVNNMIKSIELFVLGDNSK